MQSAKVRWAKVDGYRQTSVNDLLLRAVTALHKGRCQGQGQGLLRPDLAL